MGFFVTRIQWSGPAIRELEASLDFIAQDNRDAADRLAEAIYKAVSRLQRFPASGRMVPELEDPSLREVIHQPFRVIYQQRGRAVEILAVVRAEQGPDFQETQGRSV
jgi:plasmid stabilization system protein ParE